MKAQSVFLLGIISTTIFILFTGMYLVTRPEKIPATEDIFSQTTHTIGNSEASMVLIEFSDFECPACGAYKPVVDELIKRYSDRMLFGYRHYPLPQHTFAIPAAIASEAAFRQGKFWEMNDYLFDNQKELTPETIRKGAEKLELDMQKFDEHIKDQGVYAIVESDKKDGNRLGVNSTPTFYLNGKKLNLRNPNELLKIIEDEIKK